MPVELDEHAGARIRDEVRVLREHRVHLAMTSEEGQLRVRLVGCAQHRDSQEAQRAHDALNHLLRHLDGRLRRAFHLLANGRHVILQLLVVRTAFALQLKLAKSLKMTIHLRPRLLTALVSFGGGVTLGGERTAVEDDKRRDTVVQQQPCAVAAVLDVGIRLLTTRQVNSACEEASVDPNVTVHPDALTLELGERYLLESRLDQRQERLNTHDLGGPEGLTRRAAGCWLRVQRGGSLARPLRGNLFAGSSTPLWSLPTVSPGW